jgi:hypothetical protein
MSMASLAGLMTSAAEPRAAVAASAAAQRPTAGQLDHLQVQAGLDGLFRKLMEGNLTPGIGSGSLPNGISYARTRDGARLFFRKLGDTIEIVGKSDKKYDPKVIARLKELYGS